MQTLPPDWCYEATGENGNRIIGSRDTVDALCTAIKELASIPETAQITIHKRRRDYDPLLSVEQMKVIINEKGRA